MLTWRRGWLSGRLKEKPTRRRGWLSRNLTKRMEAERKAGQEVVARLEAIHKKTDTSQMRLKPKMKYHEKMDANLKEVKEDKIQLRHPSKSRCQLRPHTRNDENQPRKDVNQDGCHPREE